MGLGVLLAEDGVAQVAKVLETALDIQVGHQGPLAEVPVQGQPACFGTDCAQELGAPGGGWEHTEETLKLYR